MKAYWVALACCLSLPAFAETEHPPLPDYAAQARQDNPAFAGFSAERNKVLYLAKEKRDAQDHELHHLPHHRPAPE